MKIIAIFFLFFFVAIYSFAQTTPAKDSTYWRYAQIIGSTSTSKFTATKIDYGQNLPAWFKTPETFIDTATGKPIVFRSAIDALNYMSVLGWELVQSYEIDEANSYLRFLVRRKEKIVK